MRLLLIISGVVEAAVGLSLLILPGFTVQMLLGAPFETPQGSVAGRVAGAALVGLGLACWNLRKSPEAAAIVAAMCFYNFATVAVLVYAGTGLGLGSPMLWPTIVLHFAIGLWCMLSIWSSQKRSSRELGQE